MMSKTIVLNKDGESAYPNIQEKLARVKTEITATLENVKMNITRDRSAMKPIKNNYNSQVSNKLNSILRREKFLDYTSAINIEFEYLQESYFAFLDLLDFIYEFCPEYVPTKVTFCAFVGTTTDNYNKLRYGNDTEIIELLSSADDLWYDSVTSSAMANVSQSKASLDYAREKNKGLAIDLKSENTNTTNILAVEYSKENRAKLLQNILGGSKK